jgi:tRNA1(Val) A37 N6-methylase TrmN6
VNSAGGAENPTTDDVFLTAFPGGSLQILQPRNGLRSGLDAVMLAASVGAADGDQVLDAGAGAGVVGLALARRCAGVRVTLVEREPELAALARANAQRNGLGDRATVVCADLLHPLDSLAALGLRPNTFDHVLANPPFYDSADVRTSPHDLKSGASAFEAGDLDRWLRFLAAMAKSGGSLTLIHRAGALVEILDAIGNRFGALKIYPLFPRTGAPAGRILVQGIKGSRGLLQILPGLVLHDAAGGFTSDADAILRYGAPLSW